MSASPAVASHGARLFAWSGALLFFGSLLYFLVAYETRFAAPASPGPLGPAIAWNVFLFSAFALHHSLFARLGVRRWVARTLAPDLERSCYVYAASLLFFGVTAGWRPVAGTVWDVTGGGTWVLRLLQVLGLALSIGSAALIDIFELAGVTVRHPATPLRSGGDARIEQPRSEFMTTGPYGWVRHPIYLGWLLLVFSVATMTMTRLVFAALSALYIVIALPFEERTLRATSGGAYERYMEKVRWKLLPRVF